MKWIIPITILVLSSCSIRKDKVDFKEYIGMSQAYTIDYYENITSFWNPEDGSIINGAHEARNFEQVDTAYLYSNYPLDNPDYTLKVDIKQDINSDKYIETRELLEQFECIADKWRSKGGPDPGYAQQFPIDSIINEQSDLSIKRLYIKNNRIDKQLTASYGENYGELPTIPEFNVYRIKIEFDGGLASVVFMKGLEYHYDSKFNRTDSLGYTWECIESATLVGINPNI